MSPVAANQWRQAQPVEAPVANCSACDIAWKQATTNRFWPAHCGVCDGGSLWGALQQPLRWLPLALVMPDVRLCRVKFFCLFFPSFGIGCHFCGNLGLIFGHFCRI